MENGSSNPGPPMRGGFRGRGGNEFFLMNVPNVIKLLKIKHIWKKNYCFIEF